MQYSIYNPHREQLDNLIKALYLNNGFSLLIAEFDRYAYRDMLIAEIDKKFKNSVILEIAGGKFSEFVRFENQLLELSKQFSVIHITNEQGWLYSEKWPEFYKGMNYHREKIAEENPVPIIFWMTSKDVREFALTAPDMWHWRSGVFHFVMTEYHMVTLVEEENIQPRIDEILDYLKKHPEPDESTNVLLFQELAELYYRLANYQKARKYLLKELDLLKNQNAGKKKRAAHKILVVDDEPDWELLIRERFKKQIGSREWEFIFARDGDEALEKMKKTPGIAVILLDINLPKKDGLTFLKELKGLKNSNAKVVMVTAFAIIENVRAAMNEEVFLLLSKSIPNYFGILEHTIQRALKQTNLNKKA